MRRLSVVLIALSAVACSDAFMPTIDNMAGTYYASTLTITDSTGMHDILAAGGSQVTMTLTNDGGVGGSMLIKGGNSDGSDFAANLAGTWHLTGTTITFDQAADTFIRDADFTADKSRLSTQFTASGTTIRLVLDGGPIIAY